MSSYPFYLFFILFLFFFLFSFISPQPFKSSQVASPVFTISAFYLSLPHLLSPRQSSIPRALIATSLHLPVNQPPRAIELGRLKPLVFMRRYWASTVKRCDVLALQVVFLRLPLVISNQLGHFWTPCFKLFLVVPTSSGESRLILARFFVYSNFSVIFQPNSGDLRGNNRPPLPFIHHFQPTWVFLNSLRQALYSGTHFVQWKSPNFCCVSLCTVTS